MKYQDVDGEWKDYPSSFTEENKEELFMFLTCAIEENVTLHEIYEGNHNPSSVAIRHDVDHSLDHALKFARMEAQWGVRSTYFILHSAYYYKDKETLYKQMRELQDLGHEVGLHTDGYGQMYTWPGAITLIKNEIQILKHNGFDIKGIAAHGGTGKHTDDELFSSGEYVPSDFGVDYEAYTLVRSLDSVTYISDNRGQWRARLDANGKQTVMLIHPCHWSFDD